MYDKNISPQMLSIVDAAKYIGVSPFTVRQWIYSKKLKPITPFGIRKQLIRVSDLDSIIADENE